jgi:hypothetical protein
VLHDAFIAVLVAVLTLAGASWLDDQRSEREAKRSEALGWRLTLASGSEFEGLDASDADLSGIYTAARDMRQADFSRSDLSGATFVRGNLAGAIFDSANLTNTRLRQANLVAASFIDADLSGADLTGADISYADLDGATIDTEQIDSICWNYATRWPLQPPPSPPSTCGAITFEEESAEPVPDCPERLQKVYLPALPILLREEAACAILGYLSGQEVVIADDQDALFDSMYGCGQIGKDVDPQSIARLLAGEQPLSFGWELLFAGVEFICKEHRLALQGALKTAREQQQLPLSYGS